MASENLSGKDIVVSATKSASAIYDAEEAPWFTAELECIGPTGPKWKETVRRNTVMTVGKAEILNRMFGGKATSSWYMGLYSSNYATNTSHNLSDLVASEITMYGTARPTMTWTTNYASNITTASSSATYGFTGSCNLSGAFLANISSVASTAGVLYSAGGFAATRAVLNGDTLNVTLTLSFT